MKSTILSLAVLASLLATLITQSQTTEENPNPKAEANLPRQIRIQAEFIEMPEPLYTKLMATPRTSTNDTALRAKCAELISAGDAHIRESMAVTALPGQTATTESISELIYPTEYDPGEMPNEVNGVAPGPNTQWATPPTPASFDTKNLGSTFEVEAKIADDNSFIEVRCTPTIVYHVDTLNYGAEKISGAAGPIEMPVFFVLTCQTEAVLVPGQPTIIATLSPPNEKGFPDSTRKILVFLRADILTVGK